MFSFWEKTASGKLQFHMEGRVHLLRFVCSLVRSSREDWINNFLPVDYRRQRRDLLEDLTCNKVQMLFGCLFVFVLQ